MSRRYLPELTNILHQGSRECWPRLGRPFYEFATEYRDCLKGRKREIRMRGMLWKVFIMKEMR